MKRIVCVELFFELDESENPREIAQRVADDTTRFQALATQFDGRYSGYSWEWLGEPYEINSTERRNGDIAKYQ